MIAWRKVVSCQSNSKFTERGRAVYLKARSMCLATKLLILVYKCIPYVSFDIDSKISTDYVALHESAGDNLKSRPLLKSLSPSATPPSPPRQGPYSHQH